MPEISFSLVTSQTQKQCKNLQIGDVEAVIDVTGPFNDVSSLQKLRDGVSTSFEAHRKNLAELILKHDELIGEAESESERDKLMKTCRQQQEAAMKRIEKVLQEKMDAIKQKLSEGAKAEIIKDTQFKVSLTWSLYKLTKTVLSFIPSSNPNAQQESPDVLSVVKDIYDSLKELVKLTRGLWEYIQSEQDVRSQIEATRKTIRSTKGKPTESQVDKLESQLKAHGIKIAALEKSAREMAKELERLLKESEAGGKEVARDMEGVIDECIKAVIRINEGVEKAQDYHQRSQDALRDARKKAIKDPSSIWDIFTKIDEWYETVDDWFNKHKVKNFEEQLEYQMDNMVKQFEQLK
ncbi:MAG: hypothetical protein QM775_07705 [Pirellulales bacterium]